MFKINAQPRLNSVNWLVIGLVIVIVQGCGLASSVNMVSDSYDIQNRINNSVIVEIERNIDNDHFASYVPEGEIKKALEESLKKSEIFSNVKQLNDADYRLKMKITSVGNFWGLTTKIVLNSVWILTDIRTNEDVWKDVVRSEYATTTADAFAGHKRVRLAYEGVIRENIRLGINLLSETQIEK